MAKELKNGEELSVKSLANRLISVIKEQDLFKILVFSLIILPFTSCVDEEDFDFDSLSQTTINPSLNVPLINTEITLSDFLNLDEVSDTTNGFELRQVNEGNDSYLEFIFSVKDSFNINDFTQEIPQLDDAVLEYANFAKKHKAVLENVQKRFPLIHSLYLQNFQK